MPARPSAKRHRRRPPVPFSLPRFTRWQRQAGLYDGDIAARIGYTRARIVQIRTGKSVPSMRFLELLAQAYKVPVAEFLDGQTAS